jgi:formate/nitrite transporter FocA (FNT family)
LKSVALDFKVRRRKLKTIVTVLFALALIVGVVAPAQAQTSNILVISQDSTTKVITVTKVADNGVTGSWLEFFLGSRGGGRGSGYSES